MARPRPHNFKSICPTCKIYPISYSEDECSECSRKSEHQTRLLTEEQRVEEMKAKEPAPYCNVCLTTLIDVNFDKDKLYRGKYICTKCRHKREPARRNQLAASYGTRLTPKTDKVNDIY